METRIQILAVVASGLLFLVVLELVRRRRLLERYALLWLLSAWVLLALAIWQGLLSDLARRIDRGHQLWTLLTLELWLRKHRFS